MNFRKKLAAFVAAFVIAVSPVAQNAISLGVTAYAAESSYTAISIDKSEGAYLRPIKLNLFADSAAKLYYTTNGSKPTTSSKLYSGTIAINKTTTVRVLAVQPGKEDAYYTLEYTITGTGALYDSSKKYFYNTLTAKQKTAFDRYANALENYEEWVTMADLHLTAEDWDKVNLAINWEYPQYFDRFGGCSDGIDKDLYIAYRLTREESERMMREMEAVAAPVIAEAMKKKTTLEKVRYVIDWLVYHTRFSPEHSDTDPLVYTPYGLFVQGKGVCNAFAHCFNYIMQAMEIPVVSMHVQNGTHAANKVCIDGKWYCVDVSWTDIGYTSRVRDIFKFNYYLTSDKTFYKTHQPGRLNNTPFVLDLPKATSDDINLKIASEEARLWHPSYSSPSLTEKDKDGNPLFVTADFEIDTKIKYASAPFSFKMVSKDYNNMSIARTFDVKPNTKYRLSAMTRFSGSGYYPGKNKQDKLYGAYLCVSGFTKHEGFNSQNKWKRIYEEFTTSGDQNEVTVELRMGGPYYFDDKLYSTAKGKAWFCDVKLEQYVNGKWQAVDTSSAIGSGFYNLESVRKDISRLSAAEIKDQYYNSKSKAPAVTLTDGSYKLKKGVDYTVTYKKNKSVGTATATVTGKGLYKGTKTIEFKIVPQKSKLTITKKSGKLNLTVSKVSGAANYSVYVSKDGKDYELISTLTPDKRSISIPYNSKHKYQFAVSAYTYIGTVCYSSGYVYSDVI